jgi:signal transduction histidine kinase
MLNDLLSYSRLSTKELPKEKVEVDAVLQTVRDNLRISIQSQRAEIIERRLPPVMANSSHLIQLFQNLIANSLKFSHPDRKPEIHIGAEQMGGMVRFSVTDNGMGIEPENQEKVFGMFQRSHSVEKINGTGIGLAVCRKVVEKYGGEIRLESTYGEGTTFVFTLPAA